MNTNPNGNFPTTLSQVKGLFMASQIQTWNVPKNVIGGISENFSMIAQTTFENTTDSQARQNALDLLYKAYLAQVGTIVTHFKGSQY